MVHEPVKHLLLDDICDLSLDSSIGCTAHIIDNLHTEDAAPVEFMDLVFTCMPGESYHR